MASNKQIPVPKTARAGIMGTLWMVLYLCVALSGLVLFTILHAPSDEPFLFDAGRCCALVAFPILLLQIILAARFRPLTRPYGLDMVFRFHKAAAVIAAVALLLHPALMSLSSGDWKMVYSADAPWFLWLGRVALIVVVLNAIVSMWRHQLRIEFQIWRTLHNMLVQIIVGFAFVHSIRIGGDFEDDPVARAFWIALFSIGVLIYLYHMVIRPLMLGRHPWTVTKVKQESPNVWTLTFEPPKGTRRFDFVPGQFQFITLMRHRQEPDEEHHWTISQSPTRENVSSTIKMSGDFTATIGETKVGTKARLLGPYGRFSYVLYPREEDLVFIAGGIGITPLMAMLRHMHDIRLARNVRLIWANKTPRDVLFQEELRRMQLSQAPHLEITHFFSDQSEEVEGAQVVPGRLAKEALSGILTDHERRAGACYVCCPPQMSYDVIRWLNELGVSPARIHFERFFL